MDEREGHICMRWKSTLNFLMAKMNVYWITVSQQRSWVCEFGWCSLDGSTLTEMMLTGCVYVSVFWKCMAKVMPCQEHIHWSLRGNYSRLQQQIKQIRIKEESHYCTTHCILSFTFTIMLTASMQENFSQASLRLKFKLDRHLCCISLHCHSRIHILCHCFISPV